MYQPPIKPEFTVLPSYIAPDADEVIFGIGQTDFSGTGTLSGTVRVQGEPGSAFTAILFDEVTHTKVSETTTDITGHFSFTELEKTIKYYIVFKSPDGLWEYRVSSRRNPV